MSTARKGDLILVERTEANTSSVAAVVNSGPRITYTFGVVASATREGVARSWFPVGHGDAVISPYAQPLTQKFGLATRTWVMSRKAVDVQAVLVAAKAHHWPDHPGQPQPFDTYEEACAVARPFRHTPA